jgi:hypothetical protein
VFDGEPLDKQLVYVVAAAALGTHPLRVLGDRGNELCAIVAWRDTLGPLF